MKDDDSWESLSDNDQGADAAAAATPYDCPAAAHSFSARSRATAVHDHVHDELDYDPLLNHYSLVARSTTRPQSRWQQQQQHPTPTAGSLAEHLLIRRRRRRPSPGINHDRNKNNGTAYPRSSPMRSVGSNNETTDVASSPTMPLPLSLLDAAEVAQLVLSCCTVHLVQQIDGTVYVALVIMALGLACQVWVLMTWYLCYPRVIAAGVLGTATWLFLHPHWLHTVVWSLQHPDQAVLTILLEHDVATTWHIQRGVLLTLMLPTMLEMKAISFLTSVVVTVRGDESTMNAPMLATVAVMWVVVAVWYQTTTPPPSPPPSAISPRQCILGCYLVLYLAALVTAVGRRDHWNVPYLAGPFLLATGALWLVARVQAQDLAPSVRVALRRAILDVLATVGTRVQQDGMLQLALLRWIVDYWASSKNSGAIDSINQQANGAAANDAALAPTQAVPLTAPTGSEANTGSTQPPTRSELTWGDLSSMLIVSTNQMEAELRTLAPPPASNEYDSVRDLKRMLLSMNLDEHAKPAVMAYKRLILSLPPSPRTSALVSVLRRMPATLVVVLYIFLGRRITSICGLVCLVSPILFLEYIRVQQWWQAVGRGYPHTNAALDWRSTIDQHDPMTLLLATDASQNAALLLAWINLQASVAALEKGLTAARYVQTTAVAVDFAGSLRSLATIGWTISQRGWWYGLSTIVREALLQQTGIVPSSNTALANAAQDLIRSGRIMHRNLSVLAQEQQSMGQNQVQEPVPGKMQALTVSGEIRQSGADLAVSARHERIGEIMDLVAQCEMEDAIETDFKKEICQKLADDEMRLDDPWFVATSTTLRHLLEASLTDATATDEPEYIDTAVHVADYSAASQQAFSSSAAPGQVLSQSPVDRSLVVSVPGSHNCKQDPLPTIRMTKNDMQDCGADDEVEQVVEQQQQQGDAAKSSTDNESDNSGEQNMFWWGIAAAGVALGSIAAAVGQHHSDDERTARAATDETTHLREKDDESTERRAQ